MVDIGRRCLRIDNTFRNILTKLQPIHGPRVWASVIALCRIQGYQSINKLLINYLQQIDKQSMIFIDYRLDWISNPVRM